MTPTERRRPVTRRRRIAHLGVGGILAVIASSQADLPTSRPELPSPTGDAAAVAIYFPDLAEVTRSLPQRRPLPRPSLSKRPAVVPASPPAAAPVGWPWAEVAQCESSEHWSEVTGNGFLWGLQFTAGTFDAYRGDLPTAETYLAEHSAPTPTEQIAVARRVLAAQGWVAWPACSLKLRLRR